MDKENAHKEIGRMLGYLASLYNEKHVTHVRNEDVIVKEIKMFSNKIHAILDECVSHECYELAKKVAAGLEENQRKIDSICNPEAEELKQRAISYLQKQVDDINN